MKSLAEKYNGPKAKCSGEYQQPNWSRRVCELEGRLTENIQLEKSKK
jgi:hypothetical protein